jgi:diguanylate cyclase (GGDEF)-like protein
MTLEAAMSAERTSGSGPATGALVDRVNALERQLEQYKVLLDTSAAIVASTDLTETLAVITRLLTERLGVGWSDVYDYDPVTHEFEVVAFYQLPEIDIDTTGWIGTRYDSRTWTTWRACAIDRQPVIWYRDDPELSADEIANMKEWGELSSLTVPLVYQKTVIGLLDVGESRDLRRYSDDDVRVAQAIASHAAIAIANSRARALLEEQAVTDGLTRLYNHRYLYERLQQEVAAAHRYDQALSLLMIDLDDFKNFNDSYGHPQGDRALAELAGIFKQATRVDVDVVARYGGEEFTIILPHTSAEEGANGALAVAERLRAAVADYFFEGTPGQRDARLTLSVGVAALGQGGSAADELLTSADRALYAAKGKGKNAVAVYGR